jgi:hypothetical protein
MHEGVFKARGPMGFRSTSVKHDQTWEDMSAYVPPLVYAVAENRGSVLGSLKKILGRAENE